MMLPSWLRNVTFILIGASLILQSGCGDGRPSIADQMAKKTARNRAVAEERAKESQENLKKGTDDAANKTTIKVVKAEPQKEESAPKTNTDTASTATQKEETTVTEQATPEIETQEPVSDPVEQRRIVADNMKAIGAGLDAYFEKNGRFRISPNEKIGQHCLSWRVLILPYIGHKDLFEEFKLDQPYDSPTNLKAAEKMPSVFADPSGQLDPGYTRIAGNVGVGGALGTIGRPGIKRFDTKEGGIDIATFIVAYEGSSPVLWTANLDPQPDLAKQIVPISTPTRDTGTLVAFGDGVVREINPGATPEELTSLFATSIPCYRSRFSIDPFASKNSIVVSTERTDSDDVGTGNDTDEIETILVGDRGAESEAARREAERKSRTKLIFDATEKYLEAGRFHEAFHTHLASLVIGSEDLTKRFAWSPVLKRPTYGLQFVLGVVERGRLDINKFKLNLRETPETPSGAEKFMIDYLGKAGFEFIELMEKAIKAGRLGTWNQSQELEQCYETKLAIESGDLLPGILLAPKYNDVANLLNYSQSVDSDFLVVLNVERVAETKLQVAIYDSQSQRLLGKSSVLKTTSSQRLEDPLENDTVDKWIKSIAKLISANTQLETIPKLSVAEVRDLIRDNLRQPKATLGIRDILDAKFYFQNGQISAVEYQNVVARITDLGDASNITSDQAYQRLEVLQDKLPVDWLAPKVDPTAKRNGDGND